MKKTHNKNVDKLWIKSSHLSNIYPIFKALYFCYVIFEILLFIYFFITTLNVLFL